jgi:hypothetical protein
MIGQENINQSNPTFNAFSRVVGVFKRVEDTENAIRALKDAGFDMEKVSLMARNVNAIENAEDVTGKKGNEAKEGASAGATAGTVLGGVGGLLVGLGALAIPGVGPVVAAGAEISALASTLAGAGIGAAGGGLVGALVGLGIPEEKAKTYNERIKAGDYLLMVNGNENEVCRAESILSDRHADDLQVFDSSGSQRMDRTETSESPERREDRTVNRDPNVIIIDRR